ncbi:MAG TPA: DUF2232 domain-containing protein [Candidatus Binatia bacterium]|nr:DUF2232 domain-containing protein [Candidatus Binatia bacterium]
MLRLEVISKFFLALTSSIFLFMSGLSLPPLGVVLFPFVAQPVLMFGLKYGVGGGLGVLAVAIILLALLASEELALIYGIFAVIAGLLLAALGRIRVIEHLVGGIAAAATAATVGLMFFFYGSWTVMFKDLRENLTQQLTSALRMQEKMGLPQAGLEKLQEQTPQLIDLLLQLLPALLFLSFAFIVLLNVLYLGRRYPEQRSQWFSLRTLREWKGPEPLVWGLIACGFALFVPGLGWFWAVALNLLLVISACYFAQGLAVIAFFFHKNNVPRFLRGLTYVLIVFQQIFTLLVIGLGLFDLWGDFRRLRKDNLNPSQAS